MYFRNTLAGKKTSVLEINFNCLLTQMGQGQCNYTRGKNKKKSPLCIGKLYFTYIYKRGHKKQYNLLVGVGVLENKTLF